MNSLVNYASESESESEESPSITATNQSSSASPSTTVKSKEHYNKEPALISKEIELSNSNTTQNIEENGDDTMDIELDTPNENDEGYVLAALKDLQSFAAAVQSGDDNSLPQPSLTPAEESLDTSNSTPIVIDEDKHTMVSPTLESTASDSINSVLSNLSIDLSPEQQSLFDAFLSEINAIPLTSKDQSRPPMIVSNVTGNDTSLSESQLQQTQSVQSIYSRMHQLSLLSSPTIDQKDIEARLIEFAIRILDWEQGGMKPAYFLGNDRAIAESKGNSVKNTLDHSDGDRSLDEEDESESNFTMPPYGGIVGEILERMSSIEQTAAPPGWRVVWDPKECIYGFKHITTVRRNIF
ncbi:hypothetical protein BGZ49_007030 [Haplosporangium sp. Z 27]|nr:hypothetical protein BGZ49_007030 [Haplosporangium sp. Z 27]